jgi:alpha-glucosidase
VVAGGAISLLALALGCDSGTTQNMGSHALFAKCALPPTAPPAELSLNAFYTKYLDGHGTPVVSSDRVSDEALLRACRITSEVLSARDDVRQALANNHHRVAVLATGEITTNIPEYADLYDAFPSTDWNNLRGIGATRARPVASTGEENLLCLPGDAFVGQTTLVQMLGHSLRDLGIVDVDSQFKTQQEAAYTAAMDKGLWADTPAAVKAAVYWAFGTQAWFGANSLIPPKTRAALVDYDPPLATLLATYLPADEIRLGCYQ